MFPGRIILIDDDEDDGFIFGLALKTISEDIKFQHIEDSAFAMEVLSNPTFKPPDIIFLDWNMPKLNGRQCLKTIRAMSKYDNIPIIIFSTGKDDGLREEARQFGASSMVKPTSIDELAKKLEKLFKSETSS